MAPVAWISTFVFCLLLWGSLRCWVTVLRRWRRRGQLLPAEPTQLPPWGLVDLIATVLVIVACQFLASRLLVGPADSIPTDPTEMSAEMQGRIMLSGAVATLAAVFTSVVWIVLRVGATWRDLGFQPRRTLTDLRLGLAVFLLLAPVVYAIQLILVQFFESQHPLVQLIRREPRPEFFLISSFAALLVAPLAEEYLFRVLLQSWLERVAVDDGDVVRLVAGESASERPPAQRRRAPFWPVLGSSAVFALLHLPHGPDFIPLFVLALGFGYVYQRTRRILPCVIAHFLLNAVSLLFLFLSLFQEAT